MVKTKLGMRIIKTGIGIYLALLITGLLGFQNGALAAITAVVGLQPSLEGSVKTIKNQFLATVIGCSIALVMTYLFPVYAISIALAAIITIWICIVLGWQDSISLAVVTLILIAEAADGGYFLVISQRVCLIAIGLIVAFLLNLLLPPKHLPRLQEKIIQISKAYESFFVKIIDSLVLGSFLPEVEFAENKEKIKKLLRESWKIYNLAVGSSIKYFAQDNRDFQNKFRKILNTLEGNIERIIAIHYSICAILANNSSQIVNEKTHNYLQQIYYFYQKVFSYILSEDETDFDFTIDFNSLREGLLQAINPLFTSPSYFQPINYYSILVEGERIVNDLEILVEDKRRGNQKNREQLQKQEA